MDITPVCDTRTLSLNAVYSIDGYLYRYLGVEGTNPHQKYLFEPLPAQRRTAVLTLNRNALLLRCSVVQGHTVPPPRNTQWTQLSLSSAMNILRIFTLGRDDHTQDVGRHYDAHYSSHADGSPAVGRKPVRYFIDGVPLIDDICETCGECLEALTFGDKLHLIAHIAQTMQRLEEAQGAMLHPSVMEAASRLTDIPLDACQALLQGLMDDTGNPITRHIDGFDSIHYLVQSFGCHLEDLAPIDHYLLVKETAQYAQNHLHNGEVLTIVADDIEEVCQRLHELYGDYNNGLYVMEAIVANLQ